ncbi:hypothetical protein GLYMA_20G086451v4 [Glycine max]|nr:hypothetical protein GLYMA_20G086451v4 [Glycine max]KAH1035191.1 hypothetical protein GYH30_055256 [Glycine max]
MCFLILGGVVFSLAVFPVFACTVAKPKLFTTHVEETAVVATAFNVIVASILGHNVPNLFRVVFFILLFFSRALHFMVSR